MANSLKEASLSSDSSAKTEASAADLDVSVVLPALNEAGNIKPLIQGLCEVFQSLALKYEVIVMDGGSTDSTWAEAEGQGALCFLQKRPGYGGALREGLERAQGEYVLSLDCDMSHPPALFKELWQARLQADIVVASRFVAGGNSGASAFRQTLSVVLNFIFARVLQVPVKDSSSGYRLYRRAVLRPQHYRPENFNILQEILVHAYCDGYSVKEVPLNYQSRQAGKSHAAVAKFALYYLKSLYRLWLIRQQPSAADYEHAAYNSRHFLQRYWQRRRFGLVTGLLEPGGRLLDVGCGSSRITQARPDTVALDCAWSKLRFLSGINPQRVLARAQALPFGSGSFDQVILSELLPYVQKGGSVLAEVNRVLKHGGDLVVSLPDSSRISWKVIGFLYNHLLPNIDPQSVQSSYSRYDLFDALADSGFRVLKYRYILGAELVLKAKKIESAADG